MANRTAQDVENALAGGTDNEPEAKGLEQQDADTSADADKGKPAGDEGADKGVNESKDTGAEAGDDREKLLSAVREAVDKTKERKPKPDAQSQSPGDKTGSETDPDGKPGQPAKGGKKADEGDPSKDDYLSDEEIAALSPRAQRRIKSLWRERQEAREEIEQIKPRAEQWEKMSGFLDKHGVSNEEAADLLIIGALLKSDPKAAWAKMEPHVKAVQAFLGHTLPDDLAKDVEDGVLTEERAKEIAQLRNQTAFRERRETETAEQQRERVERERSEAHLREVNTATVDREKAIAAKDPDYATVKAPMVGDKLTVILQQRGLPKNAAEATAWFDEAYAAVNKQLDGLRTRIAPRKAPAGTRPLNGRSSATDRSQPDSVYAAAREGLERGRLRTG